MYVPLDACPFLQFGSLGPVKTMLHGSLHRLTKAEQRAVVVVVLQLYAAHRQAAVFKVSDGSSLVRAVAFAALGVRAGMGQFANTV